MPPKETYDTVAGEDRDAENHGFDSKKSVDDPLPLRKYRPDYKTINSNATIQTTGPAKDRGAGPQVSLARAARTGVDADTLVGNSLENCSTLFYTHGAKKNPT